MDWCLFAYLGQILDESLPLVVDIPVETFAVYCYVCAVLQDYHVGHLERFTLPVWKYIKCDRAGNIQTEGRDLYCRYLTFMPPYSAS